MMRKYIYVIIGIFFLASIFAGMTLFKKAANSTRVAPDLSFSNYFGEIVSLKNFHGTPLVINSWAVWCPFCREELVDFANTQEELGDAVKIIAINRAESLETAHGFTDEIGATDTMIFLLDPNDSFYRAIGGFSMPETIFVDKNGIIRIHKRGPMNAEEIRANAEHLLQY